MTADCETSVSVESRAAYLYLLLTLDTSRLHDMLLAILQSSGLSILFDSCRLLDLDYLFFLHVYSREVSRLVHAGGIADSLT